MNRRNSRPLLVVLPGLLLLLQGCGSDTDPPARARSRVAEQSTTPRPTSLSSLADIRSGSAARVALLVGIDRYEHADSGGTFADLRGPTRDVGRFRGLLIDRFGFAPQDITVLADEQATHANIVHGFKRALIDRARDGTEAVFFFAGHGSQAPDASGEVDGKDETFVAYDSRRNGDAAAFDVTDDEIYSLVAALCERTDRVTVITDSCHSGSSVRGQTRARAVPAASASVAVDALRAVLPVPLVDDGDPERRNLPYVHLAACRSEQEAKEWDVTDSQGKKTTVGLFSWLLCEELTRIEPGTTYEQLAQRVATSLRTRVSAGQQPTIEGQARTRHVFGGSFGRPLRGFAARSRRSGDVGVDAGWLHGLAANTVMAIFDVVSGSHVGRIEIGEPRAISSSGKWLDRPPPQVDPDTALRADVADLPAAEPPLLLQVPTGEDWDALAARLQASTSPRVQVLRDAEGVTPYSLDLDEQGRLVVLASGDISFGEPIAADRTSEAAAAAVLGWLGVEVRYRALMRLAATPGDLTPGVELVLPDEKAARELRPEEKVRAIRVLTESVSARGGATPGLVVVDRPEITDAAQLRVTIPKREFPSHVHVTILSVSEDRQCTPIWPSSGASSDNRVGVGTTIADKDTMIHAYLPDNWQLARPMCDRYLVLVTTEYIDVEPFRQPGSLVQKADGFRRALDASHRGGDSPLPRVIEAAMTGDTRGRSTGSGKDHYGVGFLDIQVARETSAGK